GWVAKAPTIHVGDSRLRMAGVVDEVQPLPGPEGRCQVATELRRTGPGVEPVDAHVWKRRASGSALFPLDEIVADRACGPTSPAREQRLLVEIPGAEQEVAPVSGRAGEKVDVVDAGAAMLRGPAIRVELHTVDPLAGDDVDDSADRVGAI